MRRFDAWRDIFALARWWTDISKTACVIPWTNFVVRPDGAAHFCCDVMSILEVNGRPGNVSRDSLDDLWNADELVQIRSAMARGEKPASCSACWKQEARGVVSRRLLMNPAYRAPLAVVLPSSGWPMKEPRPDTASSEGRIGSFSSSATSAISSAGAATRSRARASRPTASRSHGPALAPGRGQRHGLVQADR